MIYYRLTVRQFSLCSPQLIGYLYGTMHSTRHLNSEHVWSLHIRTSTLSLKSNKQYLLRYFLSRAVHLKSYHDKSSRPSRGHLVDDSRNQASIQTSWNEWPQCRYFRRCPASKGSRQTPQMIGECSSRSAIDSSLTSSCDSCSSLAVRGWTRSSSRSRSS